MTGACSARPREMTPSHYHARRHAFSTMRGRYVDAERDYLLTSTSVILQIAFSPAAMMFYASTLMERRAPPFPVLGSPILLYAILLRCYNTGAQSRHFCAAIDCCSTSCAGASAADAMPARDADISPMNYYPWADYAGQPNFYYTYYDASIWAHSVAAWRRDDFIFFAAIMRRRYADIFHASKSSGARALNREHTRTPESLKPFSMLMLTRRSHAMATPFLSRMKSRFFSCRRAL